MSSKEQAMSREEVRENLDIQEGPEEKCPGCGRLYDYEPMDIYVPGQPEETFEVCRCLYCGTLFQKVCEGGSAQLYDLDKRRKIAEDIRQEVAGEDSVLRSVSSVNDEKCALIVRWTRGEIPFSPAAIDFMVTAAGLSAVKAGCHGAGSHSL